MKVSCAFPRALNLNSLNIGKTGSNNPLNINKILDYSSPFVEPDELVSVPVWIVQYASYDCSRQEWYALAVNPYAEEAPSYALFHHLISVDFVDKTVWLRSILFRGQLVSKMGAIMGELLGWSGVSAVDSARLSDCPTSSIPTAPTNIFFFNSELQICEGA